MIEWILDNFWSFWLILMLLLISVQVVTGEMTFLLIAIGALTAIIADVLGAPLYVQIIIWRSFLSLRYFGFVASIPNEEPMTPGPRPGVSIDMWVEWAK